VTGLRVSADLELPVDAVTETFAILAKRGAGKSNAAVVMAEQMYDAGQPWVAVDPKGDWWGIRSSGDGTGPGLPALVLGGQHGDVPLEPAAGRLVADLIVEQRLTCVVDVSLMSKTDMRRFLADFAERLYQANTDPLHIFAEEAHEYIPQRVTAGDARMVGAWEKLVKWGRTHGLGVTLITQRSASLNKDVLTQVETLIALRTTGPQDQAAVRAWVDEHDEGAAMLAQLRKLGNGEAFVLSPQWLELDEPLRIRFARRRTFDSGATPRAGEKRVAPRSVAEVDLAALKEAMAETIEKAKADDPKELRKHIVQLERDLAAERAKPTPEPAVERVAVPVIEQLHIDAFRGKIDQLLDALNDLDVRLHEYPAELPTEGKQGQPTTRRSAPRATSASSTTGRAPVAGSSTTQREDPPAARDTRPAAAGGPAELRSGARRMVEALGRMAPLRLTKGQWGMVAKLKTTGGTWSTYLSDIRRAGLIDENSAGYTLTDAGFEYLGGRPDPMTPDELQDHYRSVLRSGAVKMLDALIDAYPDPLTREELGAAADIVTTGGTFSTYLSDLVRNGLAERHDGDQILATDVLMFGAGA
jgi:hypothetical protein